MRRRIPNLNAIRGFEAAARHLSFTGAASELNLTQGAVSRQVAALEKSLGVALFKRMTRRIELTDAGIDLRDAAVFALDSLQRAADRIRINRSSNTVTVSVLPTIGTVWLMPRLHKFAHANPNIDVRIVTSIEPVDLRSGEADVAIRVGPLPGRRYEPKAPRIDLTMSQDLSDLEAEYLFPDLLVPVVDKRIADQHAGWKTSQFVGHLPLIHTSTRRHAWPDWLKAQGMASVSSATSLEFGHFFMALEEARAGRGIAIVPSVIFANLEYRGKLRVLKAKPLASAGDYFMLTSRHQSANDGIRKFRDWLTAEAAAQRARLLRLGRQIRA